MNPVKEFFSLFELFRLIRRLKPDLVHLVTIKPVIYGGIAARLAKVRIVIGAISGLGYVFINDGMILRFVRKLSEMAYRLAFANPRAMAIFQNKDDRSFFIKRGLVKIEKTVLIRGSGVDTNVFKRRPEPAGEIVVTLASRLLWDKGVGEFVAAARLLKERGVSARFVLVGDTDAGNPRAVPETQLTAWRDLGVVEWQGSRKDMPEVFAASHVVCLPSYREGLPKVLLEAAASGRPLIATDVPGCREVVRDDVNGILVPPKDAPRLADAIERLVSDPELRCRFGQQSAILAESDFSLSRVLQETLAFYSRLIGK